MSSGEKILIPTHRGPGVREGGPSLITPGGFQRLKDELTRLHRVDRPAVVAAVEEAAAHGDRSENAEYTYGKRKLREIDRRLNFLNFRMKASRIVDPMTQPRDRIQFGATVVLEDEDGEEKVWILVGEDEVEVPKRRISWKSPVGKALMNKKVGDEVTAITPNGPRSYDIVDMRYEPIP
jgi:transcription elongation factor GreB